MVFDGGRVDLLFDNLLQLLLSSLKWLELADELINVVRNKIVFEKGRFHKSAQLLYLHVLIALLFSASKRLIVALGECMNHVAVLVV